MLGSLLHLPACMVLQPIAFHFYCIRSETKMQGSAAAGSTGNSRMMEDDRFDH